MAGRASDSAAAPCAESTKPGLRRALLAARRERLPDPEADRLRTAAMLGLPEVAAARVVAAYTPLLGEPDVGPAVAALRERGVRVLLPQVRADKDLDFAEEPGGPITPLVEADVVIVPALAVDRAGRRLGRGGGSYDRALHCARSDALVIAVIHQEELLQEVPSEPHDVPVGAVLAGADVIRFG